MVVFSFKAFAKYWFVFFLATEMLVDRCEILEKHECLSLAVMPVTNVGPKQQGINQAGIILKKHINDWWSNNVFFGNAVVHGRSVIGTKSLTLIRPLLETMRRSN